MNSNTQRTWFSIEYPTAFEIKPTVTKVQENESAVGKQPGIAADFNCYISRVMTFSTASKNDIPLIQALAEETWWPTYGPLQPKEKIEYLLKTFYSHEALARVISNGQQEFVLLYDEGLPKGFASYGIHPQKPSVFKMHKLYVLPATHGKGYGRALLEEVKLRAKARATEGTTCQLELNVYRGNPALKFYQKMGFSVIGEVNEPVGAFFFEDYVMCIEL